ncbi:T9SS type A sorting domain-containing protein [Spirosoma areae]
MKNSLLSTFTLCCLLLIRVNVWSQCTVPALPSCAGCIPLTASNQNLSTGTYCVTTSINNLNLSGSAVICVSGAGQINGGNINGGTVIYGGSTAMNPLNFALNSGGTLRIRSSLTLTALSAINGGATLIIENSATLTVSNLDVNGKLIVEQGGILYVNNNFGINGNGSVCLNNGIVNTNNFTKNDQLNSSTTNNKGCYAIRGSVGNFNQVLTNTSSINVCLSGAIPNPNKFGSATVSANCSNSSAGGGCYAALPVRLTSFQAQPSAEGVRLSWTTSLEQNFAYFLVERSSDAITFETVSPRIASQSDKAGSRQYAWTDGTATDGTFYYRLKQVDLDSTHAYSKTVGVVLSSADNALTLKPNPFADELSITFSTPITGLYVLDLYSATGQLQSSVTGEKNGAVITKTIPVDHLPAGIYFVSLRIGEQHFMRKVIKSGQH